MSQNVLKCAPKVHFIKYCIKVSAIASCFSIAYYNLDYSIKKIANRIPIDDSTVEVASGFEPLCPVLQTDD